MCAMAECPATTRHRRLRAACLVLALYSLASFMPPALAEGGLDPDAAFPDAGGNGPSDAQTEESDHADESEIPVVLSLPMPRPALPLFNPAAVRHLAGPARPLLRPPAR